MTSSGAYKDDADEFLNNSLIEDLDLMDLNSKNGVSSSNGQIMENYLILDRLNQKNQRKQQLKLKQQQINELKQKQLELELKMNQQKLHEEYKMRNTSELDHLNSKLTSHYSLKTNYLNNNNNLKPVNNPMSSNSTLSSSPSSLFTNSNNSNNDPKRQMDQFIQNSHEVIGNQVNNIKETDIIHTTANNTTRNNIGTGINANNITNYNNNATTSSNKNNEKINRRSKTPVRVYF